jgi:hypothetical protein
LGILSSTTFEAIIPPARIPFAKILSYLMPNCEITGCANFNKGLEFLTIVPSNFHKINKKSGAAVI